MGHGFIIAYSPQQDDCDFSLLNIHYSIFITQYSLLNTHYSIEHGFKGFNTSTGSGQAGKTVQVDQNGFPLSKLKTQFLNQSVDL